MSETWPYNYAQSLLRGCQSGGIELRSRTMMVLLVTVTFLVSGCDEDPTRTEELSMSEKVAGEWECVELFVDGAAQGVTDDNAFWYFTKSGGFCSQYRTAYGEYYTSSTGDLDNRSSVLQESIVGGGAIEWRLSLSEGSETLHASAIAPTSHAGNEWVLMRTGDGPKTSCF